LDIPSSVTNIGNQAFSRCKNLTNVNISNGVSSIGYHAFSGCEKIKSIMLPDSVISIDREAFKGCTKLSSITISANITDIGYSALEGTAWLEAQPDGVVYIGNIAIAYKGDKTKLTSLILREETIRVSSYAFEKCKNLKNITFPDSITDIGAFAFHETAWLEAQPDGVIYIKNIAHTYKDERNHTSLVLREDTKKIGEYAFCHCDKLESITIPDGVTHIGKCAFWNCEKLKDVIIPESVVYIGEDAFGRCNNLSETSRNRINEAHNLDLDYQEVMWLMDKKQLDEQLEETAKSSVKSGVVTLSQSELDNLLCYMVVFDEPVYEKESAVTKIVDKIKSFIPKRKQISDDSITSVIPDGIIIHEDAYKKVLKNRHWDSNKVLTQNEIDELIRQLIKVSERLGGGE
jgi:hypothetical protein